MNLKEIIGKNFLGKGKIVDANLVEENGKKFLIAKIELY